MSTDLTKIREMYAAPQPPANSGVLAWASLPDGGKIEFEWDSEDWHVSHELPTLPALEPIQ